MAANMEKLKEAKEMQICAKRTCLKRAKEAYAEAGVYETTKAQ